MPGLVRNVVSQCLNGRTKIKMDQNVVFQSALRQDVAIEK